MKPQVPFLKRIPDLSSWTIKFDYEKEDKPSSAPISHYQNMDRLTSITVSKSGKNIQEIISWQSGIMEEMWIFNGLRLKWSSKKNLISIIPTPSEPDFASPYPDYLKTDFPELDWISLENFKRTETYEGEKCFLFEEKSKLLYISRKESLPFFAKEGTKCSKYTYNGSLSEPLQPSEKFIDFIKKYHLDQ
ncbi:MAG: hypothetical protein V4507_14955 [Verrucomicrobiota bacterium]